MTSLIEVFTFQYGSYSVDLKQCAVESKGVQVAQATGFGEC